MPYDYNKARAAWRKIATTAHGVTVARAIAKRSLIQMDTASPRVAFDAALEAASIGVLGTHILERLMPIGLRANGLFLFGLPLCKPYLWISSNF